MKKTEFKKMRKFGVLTILCVMVVTTGLYLSSAKKSYALCETSMQVSAAQGTSVAAEAAAIDSFIASMQAYVSALLPVELLDMLNKITSLSDGFRNELGDMWDGWLKNYEEMTAQLNTAMIDQSRMTGSVEDAANQVEFQRETQKDELDDWKENTPSEDSCVFDSTMPSAGRADKISRAAGNAFSNETSGRFMNDSDVENNTPEAGTESDWSNYENLFCNANANNGQAGCTADGSRVDADINITTSLYGKDTLDVTDAEDATVIKAAMNNLMGRPRSSVMPPSSFQSADGRAALLQKRSMAAQLNVSSSIIADSVTERLPLGVTMTELQDMRTAQGIPLIETSDQPSKYEIRQGYLEFINSPKFFKRLGNNSATLAQKDVHMKALKLITLNDLIAQTERLTTLFAVELGNKVETTETVR
ncbi:MAG: hypothetical protein ACQEQL_04260 [Pseudomonadota bacterium]